MGRDIPDYIQRKIDRREQRARHRREAAPDCACIDCAGPAGVHAVFMAKLEAAKRHDSEIPF